MSHEASESDLAPFLRTFQRLGELAQRQLEADQARGRDPLVPALEAHLGTDPRGLAVLTELVSPLRVVDADVAVERVVAAHGGGTLLGIGGGDQRWHNGLSEILQVAGQWGQYPLGPVDYTTVPTGPDSERATVGFGLHLFHHDGVPVVLLQRGGRPQFGSPPQLEVLAAAEGVAPAVLGEVREAMNTHSVLRGQVFTFTASNYEPGAGGVTFVRRPAVTAEEVVLPDGLLARVERHVLGIGRLRAELAAAGQHLKRGVLLYGPPGTGKTHTVRHLVGAARDSTVILLSGQSLQLVTQAADTARALQPAIVVLEDCDLVAEERSHHSSSPLLFEVLDALDGLAADSDVVFLLTTNRADVLEPALAQRPGRVDLAVEIPLPDARARRALLDLYAAGLPFDDDVLEEVAAGAEGTTASFAKELVRRSVLRAVERGGDVDDDDLRTSLEEMMADGGALTRVLLGGAGAVPGHDPAGVAPAGWSPAPGAAAPGTAATARGSL
ncbi:ATPase family protein associated with various cellular activities (AAA) [Georgenia soli]|uniref:ATPase family protein associated with various cellular activities (AAA) n=1 Tax=Georgenia soli TaxID=638953 RepID=A0A2A9EPS2_9MICO|nr:ATP-binding protein [Georgenia soli]PFG40898.1 ATPase family protein associated with various cellular activities (AAA) [Georgenia soli]